MVTDGIQIFKKEWRAFQMENMWVDKYFLAIDMNCFFMWYYFTIMCINICERILDHKFQRRHQDWIWEGWIDSEGD